MIEERVPSILLLDVGLPDMTGYEVISELRRNPLTRLLPLIVHTHAELLTEEQSQLQLGPKQRHTVKRWQS